MNIHNDNKKLVQKSKKSHITLEQRKVIANMINSKNETYRIIDIAIAVGITKGAVHKEIVKNGKLKALRKRIDGKKFLSNYKNYDYFPIKAQQKYEQRFLTPKYLTKYKFALEWINKNLQYDNSMYEMQQLFIQSNPDQHCPSESTLYYYWHRGIIKYQTNRKPRKKTTRKDKWLKDENKVSIEERPEHINNRSEFGHWEIDTVIDGDKMGGVITFNERITCNYHAIRVENKRSFTTYMAICELISKIGLDNIKSITSDNGTEFACFMRIVNQFSIPWYFCHPYSSFERGQNEHLNGEFRFYFPKGTSFFNKTQSQIDTITNRINNKIRKSLNGLPSNDLYKFYVDNAI